MATFLTDMIRNGYTQDEVFAVLFESEREKKRREMLARVTNTVDAHRPEKMRELPAFEKQATFRGMNGFDRDVDREYDWRSLPPTLQEFCASLRLKLQKLKDAILMSAENTVTRPWQKTINFVDGLKGKLPDEKLAVIKRYVDTRSREATQAQVTVTPDDTVQHCSPCSPNPDTPSDVRIKFKSNKGKIDPERGELESPSAGTGLETPGQQCPPNEGTWDQGRITASGFLTAGVDLNQGGNIFSLTTESGDARAGNKSTRITADITFLQQGHKPRSEENKQFDSDGKGEKAPPWNATVTLLSFSGESWEAPCLCFVFYVCALSVLCANLFSKLVFLTGDQFSAS